MKTRKRKAAKSSPHWDAVSISEAFDELTKTELAVWMRLCTMTPNQLAIGRNKLFKILNYNQQRASDHILRNLSDKGYILFEPKGVARPTGVLIAKRPRITSTHYFVKV